MAQEPQITDEGRIVQIRLSGAVSASDIAGIISRLYPTLGNKGVAWDLRSVDVSGFTPQERRNIAAAAKAALRPNGTPKIAYIVSAGANFVAQCKYMNEAVAWSIPAEYAVFMDPESALAWLHGAR